MKGTPFYTGEYGVRQGPVEDRVNLWPALYYRKPALSVLWPLVEVTDEYFAFRPLLSVDGINDPDKVVNVLWPIAQFDEKSGDYRVFPAFWGKDYAALFPLYWHFNNPFKERGYDGFVPVWSFYKDSHGYSTWLLWPLLHFKDRHGEKGWHVWPLAGSYRTDSNLYSFMFWPLGHLWSRERGEEMGHTLLPAYWYSRDSRELLFASVPFSFKKRTDGSGWQFMPPLFWHSSDKGSSTFLSLLFSRGSDEHSGRRWSLLFPLLYSSRSPAGSYVATLAGGIHRAGDAVSWLFLPFLSGGRSSREASEFWLAGPLVHHSREAGGVSQHVFPLYFRSYDKQNSLFLSLPWSSGSNADGDSWRLLPPLFYSSRIGGDRTLITPVFSGGSSSDGRESWQTVLPLYYLSKSGSGSLFATLVGGWSTDENGRRWLVYPLLSGGRRGEGEGEVWLASPFFHAKWDAKGASHYLLPLYYWNGRNRTFVSPLAARWKEGESQWTAVPPALTLYSSDRGTRDLWSLGGLTHFSWGENPGAQHILPLFYADARSGTFISPIAARWRRDSGGATTWMVPAALSWLTSSEKRKDMWLLGPLAHASWGEESGTQHVFPLFYRNRDEGTFISIPYSSWSDLGTRKRLFPPFLSLYSNDGSNRELYALLGLFRHAWGNRPTEGHLLPLYMFGEDHVLTPIAGWDSEGDDAFFYPLTPIFGVRIGKTRSGSWFFPLYSHRRSRTTGEYNGLFLWGRYWKDSDSSGSGLFPVYHYKRSGLSKPEGKRETEFWSLPACWYRDRITTRWNNAPGGGKERMTVRERKNGFFPLWSYTKREGEDKSRIDKNLSVLWLLFDHKRQVAPCPDDKTDEYTRTRVLWRLWHHERSNGAVSLDVFPAITYDSRPDGYRKTSFLWRFFSYERGKDGSNLYFLFMPLHRSKSGSIQ